MDYFVLSQDKTIKHTVKIQEQELPIDWQKKHQARRNLEFEINEIQQGQKYNFLVKSHEENVYPNLLEIPLPLISPELKEVFTSYESNIQFNFVLLSDSELKRQHVYWIFALDRIDCVSIDAEFYPNGLIKNLVLEKSKIKDRMIFRIKDVLEKKIIICSDVAESILRRPITGIVLEKVNCV